MFGMNPEYVPGGVHNFWTRSPPAEGDGPAHATAATEALTNTAVATGGAMMTKRGGFLTGFFTNSEYMAPLQATTGVEVSAKGAMMKEDAKVKQRGAAWPMPKLTLDFYALPPLNGSY